MMEALTGALSNILKEDKKYPRDRQREVTANINSTIEELDDLQEEISILPYEEVGETRLNDLMGTAKELSERLKKLRPQATTLETRNLINAIKTSSAWLRSAQRSSVKNLTQICFAQKSLSAGIGSEKVSF